MSTPMRMDQWAAWMRDPRGPLAGAPLPAQILLRRLASVAAVDAAAAHAEWEVHCAASARVLARFGAKS